MALNFITFISCLELLQQNSHRGPGDVKRKVFPEGILILVPVCSNTSMAFKISEIEKERTNRVFFNVFHGVSVSNNLIIIYIIMPFLDL